MKILFLDQFSDLGGAQLNLLGVLPAIAARGWSLEAALPGEGRFSRALAAAGIPLHHLPVPEYRLGRKGIWDGLRFAASLAPLRERLRRICEEAGTDLLYVNGPRLLPVVAGAKMRIPVLFHAHNRVALAAGKPLVHWSIRTLRPSVIAASRFLARQYEDAEVIYTGMAAPPGGIRSGGRTRIGMIGRFTPQKRQREFAMAAAMLARKFPELEFVLCGDALSGDAAGAAYRNEVLRQSPPAMRMLGWQDDVGAVLRDLDLLVLPSSSEGGVPRVVLEAFACGVPVLAADSGAVPEAVEEGRTGFLLRGGAARIAARVEELLCRPDLLRAAAAGGRRLWEQRFQLETYQAAICGALARAAAHCSERRF